jgi:hypothetical protein
MVWPNNVRVIDDIQNKTTSTQISSMLLCMNKSGKDYFPVLCLQRTLCPGTTIRVP